MNDVQKVHIKDIEILPIGYLHSRLSSYYLLGNSFQTTIRSVCHPKSTIQRRITETLQELQTIGGVPNFFGHQRFGTARPTTHLTGKAIIKGNLRKAAMIYLAKPSPYEHPESRQARKQLKDTQDFKQAFKDFPQQLRYERLMLEHLFKKSNDFAGAFRRLPIKLRELFIQACQSYLFNRFLSRRVEHDLPLNAAEVGDYVVRVEHSGLPMVKIYKTVGAETRKEINAAINNGKMRLAIPLIGFRQRPSQGLQGEIEKQVLDEEDVSPQDFKAVALPETSERGTLRTAITSLNNFSVNQIVQDSTNPPKQAVTLSFMLLRASYATVLLRELIKPRNITKEGF
jgi:tRNA pseudouridine13 synthase